MSHETEVCLTFDAAVHAAITMENNIYQNYLKALGVVRDEAARDILLEAAMEQLTQKHKLEQASLKGSLVKLPAPGPVSIMNLTLHCCDQHQIDADADARKALAFAIQMAQDALKFYREMASRCVDAPMAKLFTLLGDEQTRHLQPLEDIFEEHCLPEG